MLYSYTKFKRPEKQVLLQNYVICFKLTYWPLELLFITNTLFYCFSEITSFLKVCSHSHIYRRLMHLLFCTHRPKSNIHRRPLLSKQSHLKGLLMLLPRDEAPVKRTRSLTALIPTKTHPQYWHMITLVIIKLTDEVLLLCESTDETFKSARY